MVDFNNEATIGTPALEVEKISILQRRYDFIEALEDYKKKRMMNSQQPLSYASARLFSLFLEVSAMLQRRLKPEDFALLKINCYACSEELRMLESFTIINRELDTIQLIKIDTSKVYDATDIEAENKIKGY